MGSANLATDDGCRAEPDKPAYASPAETNVAAVAAPVREVRGNFSNNEPLAEPRRTRDMMAT